MEAFAGSSYNAGLWCDTTPYSLILTYFYCPQDYIVTFEDEINFVWRVAPRFSMAKLLFIAVRYAILDLWSILKLITASLFINNEFFPSIFLPRVRAAIGKSK